MSSDTNSETLSHPLFQWLSHDSYCRAGWSDWAGDSNIDCTCGLDGAVGFRFRY